MSYLEITKKKNYAIVQMNRPKVNAINAQMVAEIRAAFKDFGTDDSVKGVIMTGLPGVFSAGLDLPELYNYDKPTMRQFFIDFGLMHLELAKFKKPFICGITGHSPAGGAVIAIAADYRIMAEGEKYTIGLNEVAVNIQISKNLVNAYSFWLGRSRANRYVMAGHLLNTKEALDGGLVDEVVPMEEVLPRAEKKMQKFLLADTQILINTKAKLRASWLDNLSSDEEAQRELDEVFEIWFRPDVRMKMQMYIAYLKNRKK